ncbi:MAG: 50S ribosomal protein L29 [Planctomycetota bacterium]|nr:MAG: 50S ribosomal protein L29 [Planctomycetota bacterium]
MKHKELLHQLRIKDTRELRYDLDELRKGLFEARFRDRTETNSKTNIKNTRRQIARLETILRERELSEAAKTEGAETAEA